jgi:hypothetical protein
VNEVKNLASEERNMRKGKPVTREEAERRLAKALGSRQRWLGALHLLGHQRQIGHCIDQGKWDELAALSEFMGTGIPLRLEEHDPALFKLLLKQTAELHRSGRYAALLAALAQHGDKLAAARLRGLHARERLVADEGGSICAQAVAQLVASQQQPLYGGPSNTSYWLGGIGGSRVIRTVSRSGNSEPSVC